MTTSSPSLASLLGEDKYIADLDESVVTGFLKSRLNGLQVTYLDKLTERTLTQVSVDGTADQRDEAVAANNRQIESLKASIDQIKKALNARPAPTAPSA